MKIRIPILCCLFLIGFQDLGADKQEDAKKLYVDFDISMDKGSTEYEKKFGSSRINAEKLEILKKVYEKNNLLQVLPLEEKSMHPKIIHQIWVGSKPLPDKYRKLMASWIKHHPGWQYNLWTNKDVEGLKLHNHALYKSTRDPIEKANILRYELLYKYGGLYVDIDTKCLKSFSALRERYNFYTGICSTDCTAILNNGVIASTPGHPIMQHCIETIIDDWPGATRFERTGVHDFTRCFFDKLFETPGVTIALPATYFYPLSKYSHYSLASASIRPESFSIHYWATVYNARKYTMKKRIDKHKRRTHR